MITEDYISFEVAKLLKEKGFNEPTMSFYRGDKLIWQQARYPETDIQRPTLQMALKWLREVHNIFIQIDFAVLTKGFFEYNYDIYNMRNGCIIASSPFGDNYETYEEAIEAALKYCLTNLI